MPNHDSGQTAVNSPGRITPEKPDTCTQTGREDVATTFIAILSLPAAPSHHATAMSGMAWRTFFACHDHDSQAFFTTFQFQFKNMLLTACPLRTSLPLVCPVAVLRRSYVWSAGALSVMPQELSPSVHQKHSIVPGNNGVRDSIAPSRFMKTATRSDIDDGASPDRGLTKIKVIPEGFVAASCICSRNLKCRATNSSNSNTRGSSLPVTLAMVALTARRMCDGSRWPFSPAPLPSRRCRCFIHAATIEP